MNALELNAVQPTPPPERDAVPSRCRRPRLLFIGEAVSLAHVGRPAVLARWASESGCEVHFACGPLGARLAREEGLDHHDLHTIDPRTFHRRIQSGRFFYALGELEEYVESERRLIHELNPDLVIGDFRLTLPVTAFETKTPLLILLNAYWSPHRECDLLAPPEGPFGCLPGRIRTPLFSALKPLALRFFARTLNRLRRRHGLRAESDFRLQLASGTWCAYLDHPDLLSIDGMPPHHFHLGPLVWEPQGDGPPALNGLGERRPLVYVSNGFGSEKHLLAVLRALCDLDVDFALSGPGPDETARFARSIPGLASRSVIAPLLDPRDVLERAKLTICHGGSGTLYQSLAGGVPVLALPRNSDQFQASLAVVRKGAGRLLEPHRVSRETIASTVKAILREETVRERARQLARSLGSWDTRRRWLSFLTRCPALPSVPHPASRSDSPSHATREMDRLVRTRSQENPAMSKIRTHPSETTRTGDNTRRRRPTAISLALRFLSAKPDAAFAGKGDEDEPLTVRTIQGPGELEAVYRVTHDSYVERDYCHPRPDGRLAHHPHLDHVPETAVFVAVAGAEIVGTSSVTLDGPLGLPMDDDFRAECDRIRAEGRRLAASWRLATRKAYRNQTRLVKALIKATTIRGIRMGVQTCLFTFNPRHERIYQRLLNLRTVARREGMTGLLNAPAVLMRGDTERFHECWLRAADTKRQAGSQRQKMPIGIEPGA
jgi:UDP:flavonoid glycosyltransferase YjiC (YdhE family)